MRTRESVIPRHLSHEQRLCRIVQRGENRLGELLHYKKQTAQFRESATSGRIAEFFTPSERELSGLQSGQEGIKALERLCVELQTSEDPKEEIGRMVEVLIQKDDEWVKKESGNDIRSVFFYMYLSAKSNKWHLRTAELFDMLREYRFDAEFISDVVLSLDGIQAQIAMTAKDISQQLKQRQAYARKCLKTQELSRSVFNEQIAVAEARMVRVARQLEKISLALPVE